MKRRIFAQAAAATLSATFLIAVEAQNTGATPQKHHKIVIQVSDADPAKWNLALNNASNIQQDLGSDQVAIEIVAYGPGIGLLKLESVAGARVAEALAAGITVQACENTMRNQKLVREDMLPKIGYVPSGVVQLMKRQKEGWAYIRP